MAKLFKYNQDNINFNEVIRPVAIIRGVPFGLKDNYTTNSNGEITSVYSSKVFNAIDIDWNGAELPAWGITGLHTSGELLSLFNTIPESLEEKANISDIPLLIESSISGIIGDTMANYETTESVLSRLSSYVTKTSLSNTLYDYVTKSYLFQNFSQEGGKSAYQLYLEENGLTEEDISLSDWLNSLKGERGYPGAQGNDGKSAYEIAKDNGYAGTEEEWLTSLRGPRGEAGQGTIISSITFDTIEELNEAYPNGHDNYAHIVSGNLYVWDYNETTNKYEWKFITKFQGENGYVGSDGESAYETAVRNGYEGTEEEWLESLHGKDGEPGQGTIISTKTYLTLEELEQDHPAGDSNYAYIVNGDLYVWGFDEAEQKYKWTYICKFRGENGYMGSDGESFYQTDLRNNGDYYLANIPGVESIDDITEDVWLNYIKENVLKGAPGERGEDGRGLYINGAYETLEDLILEHPQPETQDEVYLVNGFLTNWNGSEWIVSTYKITGEKGDTGYSAYEIAVKHGYEGTEEEWLESLKAEALDSEEVERILSEWIENHSSDISITGANDLLSVTKTTNTSASGTISQDFIIELSNKLITNDSLSGSVNNIIEQWKITQNLVTSEDISGLVTTTDLENYVNNDSLSGSVNDIIEQWKSTQNLVTSEDISGLATTTDLENYVNNDSLSGSVNDIIEQWKSTQNLVTSEDISGLVTTTDLENYVNNDSLSGSVNDIIEQWKSTQNLVTSEDISGLVTTTDLENYVNNDSLSGSVNDIIEQWSISKEYIDETKFNEILNNISSINSISGSNDLINVSENIITLSGIKYKDYELSLSNKIITNDNISGILASWANDSKLITSNALTGILTDYIKNDELQIFGSSNIIINKNDNIYNILTTGLAEKLSLDQLTKRVDDLILESGSGEMNTINSISVNGYTQEIDQNKNVNIIMPTKLSDLQNDMYIWHTI